MTDRRTPHDGKDRAMQSVERAKIFGEVEFSFVTNHLIFTDLDHDHRPGFFNEIFTTAG